MEETEHMKKFKKDMLTLVDPNKCTYGFFSFSGKVCPLTSLAAKTGSSYDDDIPFDHLIGLYKITEEALWRFAGYWDAHCGLEAEKRASESKVTRKTILKRAVGRALRSWKVKRLKNKFHNQ